jgi:hypothetical protein
MQYFRVYNPTGKATYIKLEPTATADFTRTIAKKSTLVGNADGTLPCPYQNLTTGNCMSVRPAESPGTQSAVTVSVVAGTRGPEASPHLNGSKSCG